MFGRHAIPLCNLSRTTISGENSEFGDEIEVKTFFLAIASISGQRRRNRSFFFRDHYDGERKNGIFSFAKIECLKKVFFTLIAIPL